MKRKIKNVSKIRKYTFLIVIVMITIFCIETVGYAQISTLIRLGGDVTWKMDGKLLITNITQVSLTRATQNATPTYEGKQVTLNVGLTPTGTNNNGAATAIYDVTLTNNSSFVHTFSNNDIQNNFTSPNNRVTVTVNVTGLTQGQRIEPGQTATFRVTIRGVKKQNNGQNYTASGTTTVTVNTNALTNGNLMATLDGTEGNLVRNPIEGFSVDVMNTRPYAQTVSFLTTGEKLEIVDSNGNPLGDLNVDASQTTSLNFYVKAKDSAMFGKSPYKAGIILQSSDGTVLDLGTISLVVPVSGEEPQDEEAPIISNVSASKNAADGSITVNYSGSDDSEISSFYVMACKENNGNYECGDAKPSSSSSSYTFTGLEYGTYLFKVYAEDEWGNVATPSEINDATTSSGHACASTSAFYRWKVTITFALQNMYYDGSHANGSVDVNYMENYSFTLTPFDNYNLPQTITVANSSGNLTAGTGYTYTQSSGNVQINAAYLTENLSISGEATQSGCLVEGTKIKLYDGTYKNIEDIKYTDLLSVWSYKSGSLTYEYPIWIEKSKENDSYQKTTFSDGTVLKTVGLHQVFSLDENKFVNIYDSHGYIKVGTRVAKEVNGKIVPVKVTKVETINEKVNYYFVGSSIYYNVISEDIITTADQVYDGMVLSNMYPFDNNIKWTSVRDSIINKPKALYNYKDFNMIPKYLFYGVRAGEVKFFEDYGYVTKPELFNYLDKILLNTERVTKPILDKNGNTLWRVTTSDDLDNKLYKEGSIYVLKEPKKVNNKTFIGWFNTVDEKYYKPGDKYTVIHGTHFIAVWK